MPLVKLALFVSAGFLSVTVPAVAAPDAAPPAAVMAAVADPGRPASDKALDSARKPAELMAFAGIKPGATVVDIFPGAYWDRLFAKVVGPKGTVIAYESLEMAKAEKETLAPDGSAPLPGYPNVLAFSGPINSFKVMKPADVVWMRQNYHDLYDPFMGPADVAGLNRAVFNALKPGGVYVIVDHAAPSGSGIADTDTTHRIDPAVVKKDMAAAGFEFVGESDALRNPADTHTKLVFDDSIRGKTDQFVYVFRKPWCNDADKTPLSALRRSCAPL
jgi:predicted methyltransferase